MTASTKTQASAAGIQGLTLDLVPARMLNEFVYCPRLAYLEWVQGEFEDSVDTVEGRFQHRRVDKCTGDLSPPAQPAGETMAQEPDSCPVIHARSLVLSDETIGAIARVDLIEQQGNTVTPVDYKHGATPQIPERAWEPERVQLCIQGLILRANGYQCTEGMLYFVDSKERVPVPFDDALVRLTREALQGLRDLAASGRMPPPLIDSPKCPRCSLVGICLPDEVNLLSSEGRKQGSDAVRRLVPARDEALPLYVQTQGAIVGKSGDVLEVRAQGELLEKVRLMDISHLAVFGNAQVTSQALRELCQRGIPVCYFTFGGWFSGITTGMTHKNVDLRCRQYTAALAIEQSLPIARQFVFGKLRNCRTLLRRNHTNPPPAVIAELGRLAEKARTAESLDSLLGIEGAGARSYFSAFNGMLKPGSAAFDFRGRNRRPPRDPVNALLSLLYAMLVKQATITAIAVGLDPFLGFYHQPKYGKPALALDLVEEFRPIIGDSVCLGLINNSMLTDGDFITRAGAVALTQAGRRKVLEAYERRLDTLIAHPLFGYSISYRRIMEVQARLLSRHLLGEISEYPAFRTR